MSKSKGNILDPLKIIEEYGLDPLRYYLIKEVSFGNDGNISQDRLEDCINSDLANNSVSYTHLTLPTIQRV